MEAMRLKWDFETLHQLASQLPEQSPLGNKAWNVANKIMNSFTGSESVPTCRKIAEEVLGGEWEVELVKSRGKSGVDRSGSLWGLGHCHIDTAWCVVGIFPC